VLADCGFIHQQFKNKKMIVKIKIKSKENEEYTMLFGNSYKKWFTQFEQYARMYSTFQVLEVSISQAEWKGWGGLKWCNETEFQEELNREGVQQNEPDNPKPRNYSKMEFYFSKHISDEVFKISEFQNDFKKSKISV
jgi:hypothetical protein